MMDIRDPLSLRNVEHLLHERGNGITYESVRFWWNRFVTIVASETRRRRVSAMCHFFHRSWHLDDVFVKISGVRHDLWRAVDHAADVLESDVTTKRDKNAAPKFLRKSLLLQGRSRHVQGLIATARLQPGGEASPGHMIALST